METIKIGKRLFAFAGGKITNDSYSATIKKLALAQSSGFVQIVPARLVAGKRHIGSALLSTINAFERGTAFSRNFNLEFLIRLFGEKQLHKALAAAEFGPEALVLIAEVTGKNKIKALEKSLNFSELSNFEFSQNEKDLMDFYGILQSELETIAGAKNPLEAFVIEKISFVALEN